MGTAAILLLSITGALWPLWSLLAPIGPQPIVTGQFEVRIPDDSVKQAEIEIDVEEGWTYLRLTLKASDEAAKVGAVKIEVSADIDSRPLLECLTQSKMDIRPDFSYRVLDVSPAPNPDFEIAKLTVPFNADGEGLATCLMWGDLGFIERVGVHKRVTVPTIILSSEATELDAKPNAKLRPHICSSVHAQKDSTDMPEYGQPDSSDAWVWERCSDTRTCSLFGTRLYTCGTTASVDGVRASFRDAVRQDWRDLSLVAIGLIGGIAGALLIEWGLTAKFGPWLPSSRKKIANERIAVKQKRQAKILRQIRSGARRNRTQRGRLWR